MLFRAVALAGCGLGLVACGTSASNAAADSGSNAVAPRDAGSSADGACVATDAPIEAGVSVAVDGGVLFGTATNVDPCDNQAEDDYSPVPEPAPIAGADGNSSLWSFGNVFQLSGVTTGSTPNGPPMQLTTTPPELAAALLVPGCAPYAAATPPMNCIGANSTQYSNGLSSQTTYTVTIEESSSGQILVLGTPSPVQPAPGKGHDVFSAASYNPITISASIFADQLFDLSGNYPQLDGSGALAFNGFAESAFPPPCATNSGICTADDSFANVPFTVQNGQLDFIPGAYENFSNTLTLTISAPEPSSLLLLTTGVLVLVIRRSRAERLAQNQMFFGCYRR